MKLIIRFMLVTAIAALALAQMSTAQGQASPDSVVEPASAEAYPVVRTVDRKPVEWIEAAQAATGDSFSGVIVSYPVAGSPLNIVSTAPGETWFTLPNIDAIGVLSVTSPVRANVVIYSLKYFLLPVGSKPYDIAFANGTIWFTEYGVGRIGRIDVGTNALTEYALPSAAAGPTGIDIAPDGRIWYAARNANELGQLTPGTSVVVVYPYPIANAGMEDVAVANDDSIWFTATLANRVGNFEPSRPRFLSVGTAPFKQPRQLVIDRLGEPWVTVGGGNVIGRYAPGTIALWRWTPLPDEAATAAGITLHRTGPDTEDLFYTVFENGLGRMVVASTTEPGPAQQFLIGQPPQQPWGITVDAGGHAWIAANDGGAIVEWRPPYGYSFYFPLIGRN